MRLSLVLALALMSASCAKAIVSTNKDHVTIKYDVLLDTIERIQPDADRECAEYGKKAIYRKSTMAEGIGAKYAQFDCV